VNGTTTENRGEGEKIQEGKYTTTSAGQVLVITFMQERIIEIKIKKRVISLW